MTFLDLAKERYSVRKFKDQPIEEEKLAAILEAGKVAPTAKNFQPQKIYVVKDKELREKLATASPCTYDAPVILVVGFDTTRAWKKRQIPGYNSGEVDASIATTHMMLEAWEQGIGSCWVAVFDNAAVAEILNLPEEIQLMALMPIGYAADDSEPLPLHFEYRDMDDMITVL